MPQFWNTKDPAPTDGDNFIYISSPDKQGCRFVSKALWREGDEEHNDDYYDFDLGDVADIAGWLPMPEFHAEPEKEA